MSYDWGVQLEGSTAVLPPTDVGMDMQTGEPGQQDLRVALLTTASMIGLVRNQFEQVVMSIPVREDNKFHAIFRNKLSNLGADLLEMQSLIPVAEQMFCASTWESPTQEVASMESTPTLQYSMELDAEVERRNIYLGSKETDRASGADTPPPSAVWSEEPVRPSPKWEPPALHLSEREGTPPLPINEHLWQPEPARVERSEIMDIKRSSKGSVSTDASSKKEKDIPSDKKKALVKFIYMLMQQKGLNDPNGHLLMDVYVEIWQEVVGGQGCGGRVAFHRFAEMLRSAPEYFELFHVGIAVDENSGTFTGKQRAKMVRLVPQAEAVDVDEGLTPRYRA
jgi:hypothetical protein